MRAAVKTAVCAQLIPKATDMMPFIYTVLAAVAGGLLLKLFKVPAGAMIGAMAAVALLSIFTGEAFFPSEIKMVVQMIAGAFIGVGIQKKDVLALKRSIVPAVILVAAIILLTLTMGFLLCLFTGYDLATALFCCAPGGVVDMALISYDMGADSSVVSVFQLIRLISVISLFPHLVTRVVRLFGKRRGREREDGTAAEQNAAPAEDPAPSGKCRGWKEILITIAVGGASGTVGYLLGLPAGTLVFSMAGVAAQNILFGNAYLPRPVKTGAQICSGALIGEGITLAAVIGLKDAVVPALLFLLGHFLISASLSFGLYRFTNLNLPTAFFSCAPGGLSEFSLIAGDFGADMSKVTTFQLLRVVCVIGFYPVLISGLLLLFPQL